MNIQPTPSPQSTRDEREYYRFEFVAKGKTFQRHALVAVAVGNGEWGCLVGVISCEVGMTCRR